MNLPELPPLPEPAGVIVVGTQALRAFTAEQVQAVALEAVRMERESIAALCEREEEAHRMFKNHQAAYVLDQLAAAIRSRSEP